MLAAERLDDLDAGDGLLDPVGEGGDLVLDGAVHRADLAAEGVGPPGNGRQEQHREQGELPVHLEQRDGDADQQQQHDGDLGQATAGEGPDGLDVGGGACHQLAGLGLVVEAEGEALDVGVQRLPKL